MTADCPSCADERAAGAAFCEACGRSLTAVTPAGAEAAGAGTAGAGTAGPPCPGCGAEGTVGADGYCGHCGLLVSRPRDHLELGDHRVAAVTDRGLRHHRNEDAVWLAVRGADVDVVVCDGVSASFDPDVASALAAETTGALLADPSGDVPKQVAAAIAAGGAAVAELAGSGDPRRAASNPACTIVAACVRGTEVGYGWVGDSRAYWVPADGSAEQLTEDDSWATQAIRLGADPRAAMNSPQAHAITAWLGADAGPTEARTAAFTATGPGHLVVCSDGLWNYLPEPGGFGEAVREHLRSAAGDVLGAARSLTRFANDAGGSDNITVALIPVPAVPA